ncbi:hypothetical protein ACODM8_16590 [Vibrio ostreicida]|uniref:Uncharacterized protein n=1 Tax=Vibrio ostreicida TaxID=526588 RepID=A0ABT8BXJ9_9VIBR|nr:hypothetical protein [Vibrio ostreicida]MDN3611383.1 hypothetical protein [Vibrio ostreicida]NPD09317.1 hypothetical protein [Vibrio ostreicida]
MYYNIVRVSELMTFEFGLVEGDLDTLDPTAVDAGILEGMNMPCLLEKLKEGELALLTTTPSKPMLIKQPHDESWCLSSQGELVLTPEAQNAYRSRIRTAVITVMKAANSSSRSAEPPEMTLSADVPPDSEPNVRPKPNVSNGRKDIRLYNIIQDMKRFLGNKL